MSCHLQEKEKKLRSPVELWQKSIHAANYNACDGCHGGNPRTPDKEEAKSAKAGYAGQPETEDIPDLCGQCHEREKESYFAGPHGEALREFEDVPVCSTCHGDHDVQKSSVEKIVVEDDCTDCHEFPDSDQIKTQLLRLRAGLRETQTLVDQVRALGMDATLQEKVLLDAVAEIGVLAHVMSVDRTARGTPQILARKRTIDARLEDLRQEGNRRRRVGIVSMIVFTLTALVVAGYRRTLSP